MAEGLFREAVKARGNVTVSSAGVGTIHGQPPSLHAVEVLRPLRAWEGADAPRIPSLRSTAYGRVNQLRDPALFEENGRIFLLYAVAGESGIAIAEVKFEK